MVAKMRPDEKLSAYYFVRILWWRAALDRLDEEATGRLHAALEEVLRQVRTRLDAEAAGLAKISEWSRERLNIMGQWLDGIQEAASLSMQSTIIEAGMAAAQGSLVEYNAMLSLDGRAPAVLPVELSLEQLQAWFERTPLGNAPVSTLVNTLLQDGIKGPMLTTLESGAMQGLGTAAAVRAVLGKALDTGAALSKRDAITLVRTYTQSANVNAMMNVYRANSDIVAQWQWCAALERGLAAMGRGTCLRCAALDGQRFELGKGPPLPLHARCRCVAVPVLVSWRALGIDLDELEEATRPYAVHENANIDAGGRRKLLEVGFHKGDYASWLAGQSATVQRAAMGPGRFALYRAGRLTLADMVNSRGDLLRLDALGG